MWRNCSLHALLVRSKITQPLWKTVWKFLKKTQPRVTCDPAIPLLGVYPRETSTYVHTNTCECVHSSIHNSQKRETTQAATDGCMDNKTGCTHTTECYLIVTRNEALIHAATWTNLENTVPSNRQSQKTLLCDSIYRKRPHQAHLDTESR